VKQSWKRIGLSVIAGVMLGFGAAAATHDRVDFQPVPARSWKISEQDKQELARLQVRNRRLEALVTAMRERANRR
jgi:hypothetical protein